MTARRPPDPAIAQVVDYWRQVVREGLWQVKDAGFDQDFRHRFLDLHMAAAARQCEHWLESADGTLALAVLLDQFPRNAFRGTAHMYATDGLARLYAGQAEKRGHIRHFDQALAIFLVFPFTHSETLADQKRSLALSARIGRERLQRVSGHYDIIRRFGRFPHRNPVLGRISTAEEEAFLATGGFSG